MVIILKKTELRKQAIKWNKRKSKKVPYEFIDYLDRKGYELKAEKINDYLIKNNKELLN